MKNYSLSLLPFLFIALAGCQPKAGSPAPARSMAELKENCLAQVKTGMKIGQYHFIPAGNSQIANDAQTWNKLIQSTRFDEKTFKISRDLKTGQATSQDYTQSLTSSDGSTFSVSQSVSSSSTDSVNFFSLSLSVDQTNASSKSKTSISESWNIDSGCQLHLAQASRKTAAEGTSEISATESTIHMDGKAGSEQTRTNRAPIPADAVSGTFGMSGIKTFKQFDALLTQAGHRHIYSFGDAQSPIQEIAFQGSETAEMTNPFTGVRSTYHIYTLDFFTGPKTKFSIQAGFTEKGEGFGRIQEFNSETWNVDEKSWDSNSVSLGKEGSKQTYVIDPSLANYQYHFGDHKYLQARILATNEFNYDHFSSYWKQESLRKLEGEADSADIAKGWVLEYKLVGQVYDKENVASDPLITDPKQLKSHPYLQESEMLQINIAPIQELLKGLRTIEQQRGLNRIQMAEEIRRVVNETLVYDHESVAQSFVYALKTSDIFARKKGVCQHFANLFAALARGMGIPTRMVVGYVTTENGKYGAHAWNEIEITDGVWRPLEPQAKDLSYTAATYFPIQNGNILESNAQDDNYWTYIRTMLQTQFAVLYRMADY